MGDVTELLRCRCGKLAGRHTFQSALDPTYFVVLCDVCLLQAAAFHRRMVPVMDAMRAASMTEDEITEAMNFLLTILLPPALAAALERGGKRP